MLAAGEAAGRTPETPEERRRSLRALAELAADPAPPEVACEPLCCLAADGVSLPMRRYTPPDGGGALLYLHGGGWVAGDLETHHGVCGALALSSGCSVFALDYRQPPEHPFPGPMEDALAALAWLRSEAPRLHLDPNRIGLAGDSAGGGLAAAAAADERASDLALLLLLCPILDLPRATGSRAVYGEGHFLSAGRLAADAADHLQDAPPDDPRASPLLGPPPLARRILVHAAACDPFRDEALDYAERHSAWATVHAGMIHYFYALPRTIPYARTAMVEIGAQVEAALELS